MNDSNVTTLQQQLAVFKWSTGWKKIADLHSSNIWYLQKLSTTKLSTPNLEKQSLSADYFIPVLQISKKSPLVTTLAQIQ